MTGFTETPFTIPQNIGEKYTITWKEPLHIPFIPGQVTAEHAAVFEHTGTIRDNIYGFTTLTFKCLTPDIVSKPYEKTLEHLQINFTGAPNALVGGQVFADFHQFGIPGPPGDLISIEFSGDTDTALPDSPPGSPLGSPLGSLDGGFGSIQYWKRKAATKKNWNSKVVDRFYGLYSNAR